MAVSSTMLALGTPTPDFSLPDVLSGGIVALSDFAEQKALLVMFICTHCPYVVHVRPELTRLARDYAGKIGIIAITSNDAAHYPDDGPVPTARMARDAGFSFPVLYDEMQIVAKAYTAACTPDFFLFGADRRLVYRGQFDDSRPGRGAPTGKDLRAAIDAVLAGKPVAEKQSPSIGCGIKWKPGNEPAYPR